MPDSLKHNVTWTVGVLTFIAIILLVLTVAAQPARSHSWYDPDCCSDRDCEPVSAVTFTTNDSSALPVMVVTTSFGTRPVTYATKIRESRDSQMHACIFKGRLICVYLPPGN